MASYATRLESPDLSAVQLAQSRFPQAFFAHCQAVKACLGFVPPHPVHVFVMWASADAGQPGAAQHSLRCLFSFGPLGHCFWVTAPGPLERPHTAHSSVVGYAGGGRDQRLHFRGSPNFLAHCLREKQFSSWRSPHAVHSFWFSGGGMGAHL